MIGNSILLKKMISPNLVKTQLLQVSTSVKIHLLVVIGITMSVIVLEKFIM